MPPDYLELSFILFILLLGMSTTYLFGPFSTLLIMSGNLYSNFFRVTLIAITNFVFTILFVSKFGYSGAAYAIIISLVLEILLLDIFYKRKLGIKLFKITIFQIMI